MKSVVKDSKVASPIFPKLMINKEINIIVFMEKPGVGTVVAHCGKKPHWEVGHRSDCWAMDCFTKFEGEVILSND